MKKQRRNTLIVNLLAGIAILCSAMPAFADRVVMTNGRIVQGLLTDPKATRDGQDRITMQVGDTRIALPRSEIRTILEETSAQNALIVAENELGHDQITKGLANLRKALDENVETERLATLVVQRGEVIAAAAPNLSLEDSETVRRTLSRLESLLGTDWPDLNAQFARLAFAMDELDAAISAAKWLGQDYAAKNPEWHEKLIGDIQDQLNEALEKDPQQGQKLLILLRQIDPVVESSRRTQYYLQIARKQRERNEFSAAIETYIANVMPENPEIARDRIKVTLGEAENHARTKDNLKPAIELYEKFGMTHIEESARERLGELWHDQGWIHLRRDEFDQATLSFGQESRYDKDGAQRDLKSVIYRRKLNALTDDDALGHYQLGIWCVENELLEPAIREFSLARKSELIEKNADTYLNSIRIKLAERELMQLLGYYEEGRYPRVLEGIDEYMQKGYPSGYTGQAIQLQRLALDAIKLQQAEKPQQAEALLQRAQRAFYQGDYMEADALLEAIFNHYKNTVVYPRARNFHELVREKIMLGKLEQGKTLTEDQVTTSGTSATYRELSRLKRNLGNVSQP